MKKQLFSILVVSILFMLSFTTNLSSITNNHHWTKSKQTSVYAGDTQYGGAGAYAVYATSASPGATVVSVYKYSTGQVFSATGTLYAGKNHGILSANLTASNGYSWNGPLTQ